MPDEKLLTVRETSHILDLTEKEVVDLAQEGKIPAYQVGGQYLRFKRDQVETYRKEILKSASKKDFTSQYSLWERLSDFIYFNDFYILSLMIILWMLIIIVGE